MNSNKINLNTISKVAFETNYGKKQSYSLSRLNDIDDLCSTNIKYNIEEQDFLFNEETGEPIKRSITDFKNGLKIPGKLLPKRIKGGIILKDTYYEMR